MEFQPSPTPKSSFPWGVVLITIFITGALVSSGIFLWLTFRSIPTVNPEPTKDTTVSEETQQETPEPTHQEHHLQKWGVSFNLPVEWPEPVTKDNDHQPHFNNIPIWGVDLGPGATENCAKDICFSYSAEGFSASKHISPDDIVKSLEEDDFITIVSDSTINGKRVVIAHEIGICNLTNAYLFGEKQHVKAYARCADENENDPAFQEIINGISFDASDHQPSPHQPDYVDGEWNFFFNHGDEIEVIDRTLTSNKPQLSLVKKADHNTIVAGFSIQSHSYNLYPLFKTEEEANADLLYLDQTATGDKDWGNKAARRFDSDGYCDGPGCSDPYVAISFIEFGHQYIITFPGNKTIEPLEQMILDSFVFGEPRGYQSFESRNTEAHIGMEIPRKWPTPPLLQGGDYGTVFAGIITDMLGGNGNWELQLGPLESNSCEGVPCHPVRVVGFDIPDVELTAEELMPALEEELSEESEITIVSSNEKGFIYRERGICEDFNAVKKLDDKIIVLVGACAAEDTEKKDIIKHLSKTLKKL